MSSVDNRIVEMQFNNKGFESGVSTTLQSLEKLKKGLNFKDSTKSMGDLEAQSKKLNFSGLAAGVETISQRFTTLGIIGVTALQNITNTAVDAGKRITEALTIQPVRMGFEEYETQINAVQTILANTSSKGSTLKDVNNALNELNKYADLTIYNFTEMTRNIGTFTAAGVDLETSVAAIKGIANLAAVSGSTSQQASTAMYQLSQALAAGTVKLQDWNSVVNAGMGGQVFQDSLKETARVHGIAIDDMIKKEGSFRETLKEGWLTSEVLTETLSKFTGDLSAEQLKNMGYTEEQTEAILKMGETANDAATKVKTFTQLFDTLNEAMQSGWTQSWQYIIGDFEEAKESLTMLSDYFSGVIEDSSEARNAILKDWSELGGRQDLFDGLMAGIKAVFSYLEPIQQGFANIIPPITGQHLKDITAGFKSFMENLTLTGDRADQLRRIAENVAVVLSKIGQTIGGIVSGIGGFINATGIFNGGLFDVLESLTGFLRGLVEGIDLTGIFSGGLTLAGRGFGVFGQAATAVMTVIANFATMLMNLASTGMQAIANLTAGAGTGFMTLGDVLLSIIAFIPKAVSTAVTAVGQAIRDILGSVNINIGELNSAIRDSLFTVIIFQFVRFISSLKKNKEEAKGIIDGFKEILENITGVLEGVQEALKAFTLNVKAGALLKIAIAIGLLAASLIALGSVPIDQLAVGLGALAATTLVMGAAITGILVVLKKLSGSLYNVIKVSILASQFRKIAVSILILVIAVKLLASSMKELGGMKWEEIAKGLAAIGGLALILAAMGKLMGNTKVFIKTGAAMLILAASIKILSSSMKSLAELSWDEIARGLVSLAGSLAIVVGAVALLGHSGATIRSVAAFGLLAVSLNILTGAIKSLANLGWDEIAKGMITLAGSLAIVLVAMEKIAKSGFIRTSAAFAILAIGVRSLSDSMRILGQMDIMQIGQALLGLAGAMIIMVKAMSSISKMEPISKSMIIFALSLSMIVAPIKMLGEMNLADMVQGLAGLAVTLLIVSKALSAMGKSAANAGAIAAGMAKLGGALIVFGIGLTAIAVPIRIIGELDPAQMLTSIAGLSGVIYALFTLCKALDKLPPISMGTVGKVALIAVVVAGVGFALSMLATINSTASLEAAAGLSMTLLSVAIALDVLSFIPIQGTLTALASLAIIIAGVSAIVVAMGALAQIPGAKWLVSEGKEFLQSVGEAIGGFFGGIVGGGIAAASGALPILGENLSKFTEAAQPFFDTMSNFDSGIADGIKNLAEAFLILTAANIGDAATSWFTGGTDMTKFGQQLADFAPYLKQFSDSVQGIDAGAIQAAANAAKIMSEFANNLPKSGGVAQFFTGESDIVEFAEKLEPFGKALKKFADEVSGLDAASVEASANAAKALAEMADNLPKDGGVFQWFTGTTDMAEFGEQLVAFGDAMARYSEKVAGVDPDTITSSAEAAKALTEVANNIPSNGGMVEFFTGAKIGMDEFGDQLVAFGSGMKAYGDSVSGIDAASITASAEAAKALTDVYNSLEASGGMVEFFAGGRDFSGFTENVTTLGEAMKAYAENVSGIDSASIQGSVEAAKALAEVQNTIGAEGGLTALWEGNAGTGIENFARSLGALGTGISEYANAVAGASYEQVTASVDALNALKDMLNGMNDFNADGVNQFKDTITNLGDMGLPAFNENLQSSAEQTAASMSSLAEAISSGAGQIGDSINTLKSNLESEGPVYQDAGRSIGESLMEGLASAIESSAPDAASRMTKVCETIIQAAETAFKSSLPKFKTFGSDIVNAVASGLGNPSSRFYNAGLAIAQGLASGINAGRSSVITAASNIASAAITAANSKLQINSPSKVFIKSGKSIDEGLSLGMTKFVNLVTDAASLISKDAYDTTNDELRKFNNITFPNSITADSAMAIRPVFDTTKLNSSTWSTLDRSYSRYMAQRSNYNDNSWLDEADNAAIISAIDDLKNTLNETIQNGSGTEQEVAIYVDSKKLASTIAKPMNRSLGSILKRGGLT